MIYIPHRDLDVAAEFLCPKERGLMLYRIFEVPEQLPDWLQGYPGFLHAYGRQILLKWNGDNKEMYSPTSASMTATAKFYDTVMQPIRDYSEPWWHGRHVLILHHRRKLLSIDYTGYNHAFSGVYAKPTKGPNLTPGLIEGTWYLDGKYFPMGHHTTEQMQEMGIIPRMLPDWKKFLLDDV